MNRFTVTAVDRDPFQYSALPALPGGSAVYAHVENIDPAAVVLLVRFTSTPKITNEFDFVLLVEKHGDRAYLKGLCAVSSRAFSPAHRAVLSACLRRMGVWLVVWFRHKAGRVYRVDHAL